VTARDDVLGRVRAARDDARLVEPARGYRQGGEAEPGSDALLDLLEDRLADYKAGVRRTATKGLRAAVTEALVAAGVDGGPVLLPPDLPATWAPQGRADDGLLSAYELDGFAAVVTACRVACAETGTIVLDGEPTRVAGRSPWCRMSTSASSAPTRWCRACRRCSPASTRSGRPRWSADRRQPATSSWTGSRACTAPGPCRWSW